MRVWAFLILAACTRENPEFFSTTTTTGTTGTSGSTTGTTNPSGSTTGTTNPSSSTTGTATSDGGIDCTTTTSCKVCCDQQNPAGYQAWLNSVQTCECTILGVGSCGTQCQSSFCSDVSMLTADCESCVVNDINNGKCGLTLFCLSDANCVAWANCHDVCTN
jgi:hypothetical protein